MVKNHLFERFQPSDGLLQDDNCSHHGRGFGSKSGGTELERQIFAIVHCQPSAAAVDRAPLTSRILLSDPFNFLYFHLFLHISFFYLFRRVKCDIYRLLYPLIPVPSKLYRVLYNTFKYILSWNQPKFSFLLIVADPISLKPYSYLWCGYIDNAWHTERFNIPNQ